jgi:hypothetical protein
MTEPICEVVVTADDEDWVLAFTRQHVAHRLVALRAAQHPLARL